ncbi:MAG: glycoside hydrolase family 9 protein [Bacteroidota bacterium]|nr:glycoside hydrolase family 9 protein [Bacteroidota bacterium]
MKRILLIFCAPILLLAQPKEIFYGNNIKLTTSQLGFMPDSPKLVTLVPTKEEISSLPDEIPFYVQNIGNRKKRSTPNKPTEWTDAIYRWPFDISIGKHLPSLDQYHKSQGTVQFEGKLKKVQTRWGTFWQADFSVFNKLGNFQIETEYGFTTPFMVSNDPYIRLIRSFLIYTYSQRSGTEIPGIREPENADDAVLDVNRNFALPLSGGWNDAGDTRKWLSQTLCSIEALTYIAQKSHPKFQQQAIEEIAWGNKYYYFMINDSGFVYEDVGAGFMRKGMDYTKDWWLENHAGCVATGATDGDNIPGNGNERVVRTTYNPLIQYLFVRNQALASTVLPIYDKNKSIILAERAWKYGQKAGHDNRTLFVSEELLAACEMKAIGSKSVSNEALTKLVKTLIARQQNPEKGISGYFSEKDNADGYRSIVYGCEPVLALLRFCELNIPELKQEKQLAEIALKKYADNYLLADAKSNPFSVGPYGVYYNPLKPNVQQFRDAGNSKLIRSFIDPLNAQEMVHGTAALVNHQAYFLARASKYFNNANYRSQAEKLLMWNLGHNPFELCLATGVGFHHPVPASYANYKIPDAHVVGFIGRLDDSPYIESSNAIEWNTQEPWGVPLQYMVDAVLWLK